MICRAILCIYIHIICVLLQNNGLLYLKTEFYLTLVVTNYENPLIDELFVINNDNVP